MKGGCFGQMLRIDATRGTAERVPLDDATLLLGLGVEVHTRAPLSGPKLIDDKVLADPDLTRELTAEERATLPGRGALLAEEGLLSLGGAQAPDLTALSSLVAAAASPSSRAMSVAQAVMTSVKSPNSTMLWSSCAASVLP